MSDSEALFTGLYEKHHRSVLAYCLRRTNDVDARDAVSEVFTVAWRRIADLPHNAALPWLYGVARRVLSRQHRSARRLQRLIEKMRGLGEAPVVGVEAEMVMRWEYRAVHEALAQLRPAQREVLLLSAWEELTNDEIGVVVGCSAQAAAQRLHRAKKELGRRFRALQESGQSPLNMRGGEGT